VASENRRAVPPTDLPLSAAALQLIADATAESARLHHEYIGTEHLLLALGHDSREQAPLAALAVNPRRAALRISEMIQDGSTKRHKVPLDPRELNLPEEVIRWLAERSQSSIDVPPDIERPFTSRTKRALSLAADSARELAHTHVGVAEVIVGIMRESKNIAAQVLAAEGLTADRAYEYARQQ
jgi:ATP-dependent Clp protease ATP-binding subunit ClpC